MTGPERDSDVDAWLQTRRSLLRNADDALTLEPPPELDQRVIDRARRELARTREEKPGFFRGSRFTMPFAIAATVVLSFSLVLEINRYEGGRDALRERAESSAAAPITLTAAPVAQAPTAPAAMAAEVAAMADNAAADAAPARRARDKADLRSAAPAMQGSMMAASPPMPAAPPPAAVAMEQTVPASIAPGSIAVASVPASAPNAASRAAGAAVNSAMLEARRAEPAASAREAVAAKSSVADAAVDNVATAAPARPGSAALWWKRVQQLRDAGRSSEAEAELKALRQAYPDFVVPAAQAQPQQ